LGYRIGLTISGPVTEASMPDGNSPGGVPSRVDQVDVLVADSFRSLARVTVLRVADKRRTDQSVELDQLHEDRAQIDGVGRPTDRSPGISLGLRDRHWVTAC
jgi:hypothetical protein